ncbi:MAG: formate acetyltransferase, partial [Peptostreptococcaceae bacterium]|nr:formate acetyltransferase [Peptostreptococcaceae bacterium]
MGKNEWEGFNEGIWTDKIDVRSFIQKNYSPYEGDESFLEEATAKTKDLWDKCEDLLILEQKKGVLDIDTEHFSGINNFGAGYIDRENESIVGLQTDAPLKRMVNFNGGL